MADKQSIHTRIDNKTVEGMMTIDRHQLIVTYVDSGGTTRTDQANIEQGMDKEKVAIEMLTAMAKEYPRR